MSGPETNELPEQIGRYEIRRLLGTGGMGVVYAAFDPLLQRDVAVKLLRRERFARDRLEVAGERLRREAQIAAQLTHPNVVTIFDVGEHAGSVYVAMELVDGPSLQQWLRATARPWREVLDMFFRAGRGLAAAHGVGLIHRDFKPANVLVGADHRPRVVDFGLAHFGAVPATERVATTTDVTATTGALGDEDELTITSEILLDPATSGILPFSGDIAGTHPGESLARPRDARATRAVERRDRLDVTSTSSVAGLSLIAATAEFDAGGTRAAVASTSTGVFVGTPAYMAPELYTGGGADARTDQFAFCVALYEGLFGERPFAGESSREIAEEVIAGNVRRPPVRSRVPRWVRDIVVRGLAVNPGDRHPSVSSMLAAFAFTSRIMWE